MNWRRNAHGRKKLSFLFTATIFGLTFLAIKLFGFSTFEEKEDEKYQKVFTSHYQIFALNLPAQINFAGEPVPIDLLDVREKMDRELLVNTYWQSQTLLFLKRSNKWFPIIEPILKKNNIPDDFKYLPLIESGFTNVVSPAGATGFWQLMKSAAKERGLTINDEVDERYHVEKATEAACQYLLEAHDKFGSWTLAAASYNMGMAGLNRRLEAQQVNNYYDLLLNEETSRYVFRILAIKKILGDPAAHGFQYREKDLYPPIVGVDTEITESVEDLAAYARSKGISYKVLKLLNPWLRKGKLTLKAGQQYTVQLPDAELANQLVMDKSILLSVEPSKEKNVIEEEGSK